MPSAFILSIIGANHPPPFDRVITQVQEALRVSQPAVAVAQLTTLLQRQLPVAQQAHTHGLLAQAYELNSQWDAAAKLLHPYEARTRTAELPVAIHQFLWLRLASLRTDQPASTLLDRWAFARNPHL